MKGEGDNIRLVHDKPQDDMPRLKGQAASEGPQLNALRLAGYSGAQLKSYREEPGAPEVRGATREHQ